MIEVRAPFGYDAVKVSDDTGLLCPEVSLTVQASREEADINVILDRFGITGQMPVGLRAPTFLDFDGVFDFRSAVEAIGMAEDAFMSMPARVRARFDNDPQKFVEFCSNDANAKEMEELGLTKEKPVVNVVAPAPEAPK